MGGKSAVLSGDRIQRRIFVIRGWQVMLDVDLAALYGVTTSNFNKAVRRNLERFPDDFMFQLAPSEYQNLTFQFGMSSSGWGGRRRPPYAFTHNGIAMLTSVLRSRRAARANVEIMRQFVRFQWIVASQGELGRKVVELAARVDTHDQDIRSLIEEIRRLTIEPPGRRREIGFRPD